MTIGKRKTKRKTPPPVTHRKKRKTPPPVTYRQANRVIGLLEELVGILDKGVEAIEYMHYEPPDPPVLLRPPDPFKGNFK